MKTLRTGTFVVALLLAGAVFGAAFTPPAPPSHWVTDEAGALSPPVQGELNARLEVYERATGRQVIVWISQTTGDVPLEDWAARTFSAWGIGSKKLDDGAAVFLFMKDRRMRIEVGYGLESVLPDALASRIIREAALPRLKAGDTDGAVRATVDELLARMGGEPGAHARSQRGSAPPVKLGLGQLILFGFLGLLLLFFVITHPRLALFLLFQVLSGSNRGGWGGGGGGGFSGGGGRSGGGGASGSW